ncbi:tRNA guanosine(15) transglycosylase TgtA [Caldivirga maquilingensis]|uniref:tRNA-guanine(15) transglycosylase n=1 Tax=Caldivirga maquilingensis (strain ATCC 700844 / DSM 13496 / JCM 10307 / IC-167) TaxID=397948 RepID=A8M9J7_CALMQ|nr:tRNA guanosine(15) transglycosylase TgtA [Caldivirga maquilingensis]ABW00878.1 tRNA-guanine transglycosylase, various specificities [Caldivirga maquilingensis IC-167]
MFEVIEKDEIARIGKLYTRHGVIETPALFPVINPSKQYVDLSRIKELGFNQIITNAYIIRKTYGDAAREVGLHEIIGWDGPLMTDSGAYQILQYGNIEVSPDEALRYQVEIGSDIGVILDIPTSYPRPRELVEVEVNETIRRARRAILQLKELDPEHRMLIVGPTQGGVYRDLLAYSARMVSELPFDIYAIGSPTTLLQAYNFTGIIKMILTVKSIIPPGKPVHLFGVGHPLILPLAVALGIDLFDSASYMLYANDDRIILSSRTVRLSELDKDYVLDGCGKRAGELMEMSKEERIRLIAQHNLWTLSRELMEIKQRIKEHDIWSYVAQKARQHPSVYRAYLTLSNSSLFRKLTIKLASGLKVNATQLSILDNSDLARPEVQWARRRLRRLIKGMGVLTNVLIIIGDYEEPFIRTQIANEVTRLGVRVFTYNEVYGLIPIELSDVYPFSQTVRVNVKPRPIKYEIRDSVILVEDKYRDLVKFIKCSGECFIIYVDSLKNIKAYEKYVGLALMKRVNEGSGIK